MKIIALILAICSSRCSAARTWPSSGHTVFGQLEPSAAGLTLVELDDEVRRSVIDGKTFYMKA